ncbi:Uncharacterized protein Rs2_18007 [Raphanus sativus]|nr:Uncharacterized protein Rs2_18007 [Raphanus sativus]
MARSKSKTGSDFGPYWTENVTWPLLCPYNVPVTFLPREEDPPVTSEISWLETLEEEDGGEGRQMTLHMGRLMRLMRERKKEGSFTLTFTVLFVEEDEESGRREVVEHLRQGTRKLEFVGRDGWGQSGRGSRTDV